MRRSHNHDEERCSQPGAISSSWGRGWPQPAWLPRLPSLNLCAWRRRRGRFRLRTRFDLPLSEPASRVATLLTCSLVIPGIECVAAADLYDGRHIAAQEALGGKDIETTREYRRLIDRKDIDAIICATPDHWHRRIVEEACQAGKDVYCEKPMSHTVEDGAAMIAAVRKYNRICEVGSQRVSSILYAKAKEIWDSGKLGMVDTIEATRIATPTWARGSTPFPPMPALKPSIGTPGWTVRPHVLLTPTASSAGVVSRITARAWPATSSCTCLRGSTL